MIPPIQLLVDLPLILKVFSPLLMPVYYLLAGLFRISTFHLTAETIILDISKIRNNFYCRPVLIANIDCVLPLSSSLLSIRNLALKSFTIFYKRARIIPIFKSNYRPNAILSKIHNLIWFFFSARLNETKISYIEPTSRF